MKQILLAILFTLHVVYGGPEEEEGVKYANKCEGKQLMILTCRLLFLCFIFFLFTVLYSLQSPGDGAGSPAGRDREIPRHFRDRLLDRRCCPKEEEGVQEIVGSLFLYFFKII